MTFDVMRLNIAIYKDTSWGVNPHKKVKRNTPKVSQSSEYTHLGLDQRGGGGGTLYDPQMLTFMVITDQLFPSTINTNNF